MSIVHDYMLGSSRIVICSQLDAHLTSTGFFENDRIDGKPEPYSIVKLPVFVSD